MWLVRETLQAEVVKARFSAAGVLRTTANASADQMTKLGGRPLEDLTVRDIQREVARVRRIQRAKGPPTEREVRVARAVRELRHRLKEHGARVEDVDSHEDHREMWITRGFRCPQSRPS